MTLKGDCKYAFLFFGSIFKSLLFYLLIFHRYAMTVWYFDADERAEAKKKFRNLTSMCLIVFCDF